MIVRVTRSGRQHCIGNAHIKETMINQGVPILVGSDQLHYLAHDSRGIQPHVIAVPDDRNPSGIAVIHAHATALFDCTYTKEATDE